MSKARPPMVTGWPWTRSWRRSKSSSTAPDSCASLIVSGASDSTPLQWSCDYIWGPDCKQYALGPFTFPAANHHERRSWAGSRQTYLEAQGDLPLG